MHFKFDSNYIRHAESHVAMIVLNSVVNDSRVIKTAQTVSKLGYQLCMYGLNNEDTFKKVEGHPFEIILLPNPRFEMKRTGNWPSDPKERDYGEFINIFVRHFQEKLNQRQPQIIHTHDTLGLAVGGKLHETAANRNFFWIHDIHEYDLGLANLRDGLLHKYYCDTMEKFIKYPDALISVSPPLIEILQDVYSLDTKPGLVLNTPRLTDFDPYYCKDVRNTLGIPRDAMLLVYSGNVKPVRGIQTVIEALPLLPEVHAAIITNSSGSFIEELKRSAREKGLDSRVHFHPYVPFNNVTSFIRTADIGIYPIHRYPNAEMSLPTKLFEYIHAGLPSVVSNNRSMEEFVNQYDCGAVFEAENAEGLVEAVKKVLARQQSDTRWSDSIRSLSKQYCWEAQEEVVNSIYSTYEQRKNHSQQASIEKNYRIFQLPVSGAGQPSTFANAMKKKGIFASSLAIGINKFEYKTDFILEYAPNNIDFVKGLLDDYISEYDVFHFHMRPLLFSKHYYYPTGIDLIMLRCAGKKVFFHFRGSEARLASVFEQCSPYNYVSENPDSLFTSFVEHEQKVFIEFVNGVCHKVFVPDPELQTYVPEALIVPRIIDLKKWQYVENEPSDVLKVVHAPSRPVVKGTKDVLAAIEKLRAEGLQIDFRLVENIPNNEAIELYKWADVVIDQLRIGWYGVLAVEAMALGKTVISYIRDDLKHYLPYPLPIAIANPDNLYDVLKDLALNPDKAHSIGIRGRKYVEELHDSGKVSDILLQLYETAGNQFDVNKALELLSFQRKIRKNKKKSPKRVFNISAVRYFNRYNFAIFYQMVRHDGIRPAVREALNKLSGK